jgi:hypothetical protein
MKNTTLTALILAAALPLAACQSSSPTKSRGVASAAQSTAGIEQIKALAGTWDILDDKGNSTGTTTFSVTSAGSAVREVMFTGQPHEMTNMYHMDGPSLVVTHYCAMGNQPQMRAAPADITPGRVAFKFDHASNYDPSKPGEVMGNLTLLMKDSDHLRQQWNSINQGKPASETAFDLRRRK